MLAFRLRCEIGSFEMEVDSFELEAKCDVPIKKFNQVGDFVQVVRENQKMEYFKIFRDSFEDSSKMKVLVSNEGELKMLSHEDKFPEGVLDLNLQVKGLFLFF
jgi:hypothetical protein